MDKETNLTYNACTREIVDKSRITPENINGVNLKEDFLEVDWLVYRNASCCVYASAQGQYNMYILG